MKLVIFGLTISSSWGNGHATLWRALCRALAAKGHEVVFFERDVPYYAAHRDLFEFEHIKLILYSTWEDVLPRAKAHLADADVAMVTSYCPDGLTASEVVLNSSALRVFYDLDTPVTLWRVRAGESVGYIGARGFRDFDLVLSYTGGSALDEMVGRLGAQRVAPLYGSVDPDLHRPVPAVEKYRADLSYLGTYAGDRQEALQKLFIEPAKRAIEKRFLIGGSLYPGDFPWTQNIYFVPHVPPLDHSEFYSSSRLTLNVTRGTMARLGYCPSGRLFEAAACGVPILSDWWEGMDLFFEPGKQILIASTTTDILEVLELTDYELACIARTARDRALTEHTAERRVEQLEALLESARQTIPDRTSPEVAASVSFTGGV